jgi:hypothetical protein
MENTDHLQLSSANETTPGLASKAVGNLCLGGLYVALATAAAVGSAIDRAMGHFVGDQQIAGGIGNPSEYDNPFAE